MVQAGTLFEYLAAFITIVLGLALSDLLVSLHRLLRARRRVVWRPLPLLLAVFVFLSLLTGFFELWKMTRWETIGYFGLVWQVILNIPLVLVTCAVLPDDVPSKPFDLDDFYFRERRYIAALLVLGLILDVTDQTVSEWDRILAEPVMFLAYYFSPNAVLIACLGSIGWSQRKWVHWIAFAVMIATACWGFSGWKIDGLPARVPVSVVS